jgi:hypothetical protein
LALKRVRVIRVTANTTTKRATPMVEAYPSSLSPKATLYICMDGVRDALPGPPLVMAATVPKLERLPIRERVAITLM